MPTNSKPLKVSAQKSATPDDATAVLSHAALSAIAHCLTLVPVSATQSARVKGTILALTAQENSALPAATIDATAEAKNISTRHAFNLSGAIDVADTSSNTPKWRAINPLVSMQILHDDGETLSWYARFQPGGRLPAHEHTGDEESLVISGTCYLNDKLMRVGDYQLCRAGSRHDNVFSEHGCLLFIRTPKAMLRSHAQHA